MSLFSPWLARGHNWLARRSRRADRPRAPGRASPPPPRYAGIDLTDRLAEDSERRALVQFATHGFDAVMRGQRPAFFNPYGATAEIVRALNELGFRVDLIDAADGTFEPTRTYDLYVGHGPHYARTARHLSPNCRKARYATGSHVKSFLDDSRGRYRRFRASRNLPPDEAAIQRDVDPATDYSKVDLLITLGEATAATYAREGIRSAHIHNAAYIDTAEAGRAPEKRWEKARRHFIYVCGTHGNVQKGLDLLLETFALHRDVHLHVYSKLDAEVLDAYGPELRLPNIHYVYHCARAPWLRERLFRRCAFTICAGINSGQSTAYLASLHDGFVPVYNAEMDIPLEDCGVRIERNDVAAIGQAVEKAARLDAGALRRHSEHARRLFLKNHQPECFREGMKRHLRSLMAMP